MSKINRDFFFDHLHDRLYPHGPDGAQIAGHEAILDAWEQSHPKDDDRWLAYMLGTAYHETARTMQPVRETLAASDAAAAAILDSSWKKGKLPWVSTPYWHKDGNGQYWLGRGLVQLTHKANYVKMAQLIGQPLDANPSLAMDMKVAIPIMFVGMMNGSFTGKKLGDYFSQSKEDWVNARRIINGLDRANDIAGYAKSYYAAISYTT